MENFHAKQSTRFEGFKFKTKKQCQELILSNTLKVDCVLACLLLIVKVNSKIHSTCKQRRGLDGENITNDVIETFNFNENKPQ